MVNLLVKFIYEKIAGEKSCRGNRAQTIIPALRKMRNGQRQRLEKN
jgi:hypothetical protein